MSRDLRRLFLRGHDMGLLSRLAILTSLTALTLSVSSPAMSPLSQSLIQLVLITGDACDAGNPRVLPLTEAVVGGESVHDGACMIEVVPVY